MTEMVYERTKHMNLRSLMKPTFWKVVAFVLMLAGLVGAVERYTLGLGATTHLADTFPWGLWIGFDILVGVGLPRFTC